MLSRYVPHIPKCCHHKATGQAFVKLNGVNKYLGPWGSKTAKNRYDQVVNEWLAQGRQLIDRPDADSQDGISIAEVMAAFLTHAEGYYRSADGRQTPEVEAYRQAMQILKMYATEPAKFFGPLKLQACQQAMIQRKWSRRNINRQTGRIKHIFKWAVQRELITGDTLHALEAVQGLKIGRSAAKELPPVRPVADELVDAIKAHVSAQVWAMIELQRITGARPGELCIMRTQDITMTGGVWVYRPACHKTGYRGMTREIMLGPKAQEIVRPFLKTGRLDAYIFSPQEAEEIRNIRRRESRQTAMTPSAERRRRRQRPEGNAGERYTVDSYRRAIDRATSLAYPLPAGLDDAARKAWRKAHRWHPHQLRHTAATNIRREFGIETARVILGHHSIGVTEIYAEADRNKACEAMARIG